MRLPVALRLVLAVTCLASAAPAQVAPPTEATAPSPAPAEASQAPAAPAPAPAGQSIYSGCVPACRSGFLCVAAQCVSLCNPACPAGEICTDQGLCVSACNPACPAGQVCTAAGQCLMPASAPAPAPPPQAGPPPGSYLAPARPASPYLTEERALNPATGRPVGDRYHDGFYLRLGVGFGWLGGKAENDDANVEVTTTGPAIPVELAIGGTPPGSGVAIGVGSYAAHFPAAKYERGRGDNYAEETADYGSVSMLGLFVDAYPDPTQGFHLLAAPCLALVTPGDSDVTPDELTGTGFGVVLGIGYESWVGEQWSAGIMARVQYASVKVENDDEDEADYELLIPAVLLTLTLH